MTLTKVLILSLAVLSSAVMLPLFSFAETYDLVIKNGRVIDPETKVDSRLNIGITNGIIQSITSDKLVGEIELDADGLVVSPGFIDMHAHGQNTIAQTYQVRDGVTTSLNLESGLHNPAEEIKKRTGTSLINFGYSAGYENIRFKVNQGDVKRAYHQISTPEVLQDITRLIEQDLDQGAVGIGFPLDYFSHGVNAEELKNIFTLAAKRKVPLFIHIRMPDDNKDPSGFAELIDMARSTGASMHMVHIVSTGLSRVPLFLDMMDKAQAEGLDITTELYPYTAGSTDINAGIFDHDWQSKFDITYGDMEWPPTGERFTGKKMWDDYRAKYPDGVIILHAMTEEWVEQALKHKGVMIGSDGMPLASLDQRAHPRGMGTFSRVLGYYVRQRNVISLLDALARMTYLPAKRLEAFTPVMKRKGRLQVGADADITIFDPLTVIDKATFSEPNQFSVGIKHVVVGGHIVVKDETLQKNIFPGKVVTTKSP